MDNNSGLCGETGLDELKSIMLNVHTSVTNMETRFNQFETSLNQVKASNKRLEGNQLEMNTTVNTLTTKVTNLEAELKLSQRKCEQLAAQSRRENLRLYGMEVSLTCVPCKLLEHIVCSNIMAHLDEHRLLPEKQHAFRKWHSCETQLITVIDDWAKILDNQGQVDTFEKAFDTPLMNFSKANCLAMELEGKL